MITANAHLTLLQVAARLGASIHTVRHWVKTGKLASTRPGRRRLVEEHELDRFLRRNARGYEGTGR